MQVSSQPKAKHATCAVKIKFAQTGDSIQNTFQATETLMEVFSFIKTVSLLLSALYSPWQHDSTTKYKLATTYPPHTFEQNEFSKTLLELQLVPNSSLLATPVCLMAVNDMYSHASCLEVIQIQEVVG